MARVVEEFQRGANRGAHSRRGLSRPVDRQKLELNASVREKADATKYEAERLADADQYRIERKAAADRKQRHEQP